MVDHYENLDASTQQLQVIDRICDGYEKLARRGEFPKLEDFLGKAHEESFRNRLLSELLPLEVEYRVRHGKVADLARLEERFPLHVTIIRDAKQEHGVVDKSDSLAQQTTYAASDYKRWYSVPGYHIDQHIGQSRMGDVYAVRHIGTGRKLALKVLRKDAVRQLEKVGVRSGDLNSAMRLAAGVLHPDIVSHFEVNLDQEPPHYSMQLIDGQSLADLITRNPLEPARAAQYIRHVLAALAAAHESNVVHGWLTPENVLVQSGTERALLSGLGISHFLRHLSVQGTRPEPGLAYLAPEAIGRSGEIAEAEADVYSVGAVLYHAITGRPPFQSSTHESLAEQIRSKKPIPPTSLNPEIPPGLESIVLRCLRKNPTQRYRSAEQLGAAITQCSHKPGSGSVGMRLRRWVMGNPIAVAVIVILFAMVIKLWLN